MKSGENRGEKRLAFAVPVWRPKVTPEERLRLAESLRNAGQAQVFFFGPRGLDFSTYTSLRPSASTLEFEEKFFRSKQTYSKFMLEKHLYLALRDFDAILVCQLDSILFRSVDDLLEMPYDYIGAPWVSGFKVGLSLSKLSIASSRDATTIFQRHVSVGNGGLSLRRTSAFLRAAKFTAVVRASVNEDLVFSYLSKAAQLRLPPTEVANELFVEERASSIKTIDELLQVRGVHGLEKFNPTLANLLLKKLEKEGKET